MSQQTTEMLTIQLRVLDRKYRRACRQAVILNNKFTEIQARYNRARKEDRKSFRHTLCLQLVTTKGVRNMYYEYARRRAKELEAIHDQLLSVGVLSDSEEETDWDVDS